MTDTLKSRFESLLQKLISFKFFMFVITTALRCLGYIGNGEWLTVTCIVICGREGQKIANSILARRGLADGDTEQNLGGG